MSVFTTKPAVPLQEAEALANALGAIFIETSAKDNFGVTALFQKVAERVLWFRDNGTGGASALPVTPGASVNEQGMVLVNGGNKVNGNSAMNPNHSMIEDATGDTMEEGTSPTPWRNSLILNKDGVTTSRETGDSTNVANSPQHEMRTARPKQDTSSSSTSPKIPTPSTDINHPSNQQLIDLEEKDSNSIQNEDDLQTSTILPQIVRKSPSSPFGTYETLHMGGSRSFPPTGLPCVEKPRPRLN